MTEMGTGSFFRIGVLVAISATFSASGAAVSGMPAAQAAAPSVLIRGGRVVDGTGAPAREADVRVSGATIEAVAPNLALRPGERIVDASGRIVAPGFIDPHSHSDRGLRQSPGAENVLMQGITTIVVGQDGGGELPVSATLEAIARAKPAINVATLAGHGTLRELVLGADFKRAATPAEIGTMAALLDRALTDGALGLSSGLEYDPGFYATPEELQALATVVARHGGFYASHVRDEENKVFEAWREAIDVGRAAHIPVLISHIKLGVKPVWGRAAEAMRLLETSAAGGVRVMADWYPYTYWQSSMYVLIDDRDFENRVKWQAGLDEIGGAGNVLVTRYEPDPSLNGKTVAEIAAAWRTDVVTTIVEMIRAAGPNIGIIGASMDEGDLDVFVSHPQVIIGSDGGPGAHPRGYGAFPRVLARYVRERRRLALEEAIAKMTGRTAAFLGFGDRGVLAPGKKADIVVFDPATIADRGTPKQPAQSPLGLDAVVVNGQVAVEHGAATGARAGEVLRR